MSHHKVLKYKTARELDFIDMTDEIVEFVKKSKVQNGLVNVQTLHTTAAIIVNEKEKGIRFDAREFFCKLVPKGNGKKIYYRHDDFDKRTENMCDDECRNGHSHIKALMLPVNVTLNLINGKLQLGTWQRIFLLELDHSRQRQVQIFILESKKE